MRCWVTLLTRVLVALFVVGCGGGSGGGPTGPTEGTLEIIASTSGSDLDPDGYMLSVDNGAPQPLPPNGADTVVSLSPGTHTVTLAGVAPNCLLGGENPRSVEIAAANMTSLSLDIACSEPQAAISVRAATTGEGLDADGYQVAVDGGTPQPLPINGSVLVSGLTPGDHEVALSDVAANCVIGGPNPLTVALSSGGTSTAAFTVTCNVQLVAPGRDIALGFNSEVYLLSADGMTFANLTNDPGVDAEPTWSPDGQKIAFTSERAGRFQIFVMNADGSGPTQLTHEDNGADGPAWSPDGGKIAFVSHSSGHTDIYVMNSNGSEIRQLTTMHAFQAAWSPDGTRIAFRSLSGDIFVMNADGTEVIQLTTEPSLDRAPSWSSDGTKIAFASTRSGSLQIHVMNSDGTAVTQLTSGSQENDHPVWSLDGSKIAFVVMGTGTEKLYMMNPDGTGQVPLTSSSHFVEGAAWRP
ncbi:MAG: hypothetical protein ACJ8EL_09785 [Rhizomicrobium sp.]